MPAGGSPPGILVQDALSFAVRVSLIKHPQRINSRKRLNNMARVIFQPKKK